MSLATLSERLEHNAADWATWADVARVSAFTLVDKFNIVNRSILAEPLGDCGLTRQVPYEIESFERRGPFIVLVHFRDPLRSYQLSVNYAKMVSRRDIVLVNSQLKRFALTRAIKRADGVFRLPFDHKPYTWDLVLTEIPRNRLHMGRLV